MMNLITNMRPTSPELLVAKTASCGMPVAKSLVFHWVKDFVFTNDSKYLVNDVDVSRPTKAVVSRIFAFPEQRHNDENRAWMSAFTVQSVILLIPSLMGRGRWPPSHDGVAGSEGPRFRNRRASSRAASASALAKAMIYWVYSKHENREKVVPFPTS